MSDDESAAAAAAGEDGEVFEIIQFLIEGVLTAALGIFGILGNIVSIKVNLCKTASRHPLTPKAVTSWLLLSPSFPLHLPPRQSNACTEYATWAIQQPSRTSLVFVLILP